ncbi:MAG: class I SAM-dependent rRNA methyltransferase [Chlamydiota bacterium]|nr:class I SAM-dependent rRNA methyltransferase [Chlamydiota bacterium]
MKKIVLYHHKLNHIIQGHPWVYNSQVKDLDQDIVPGECAAIVSDKKRFIGIGYYNPKSKIPVRILTRRDEPVNADFWRIRFQKAFSWRTRYISETNAIRLINSESDDLPGLIVDQYDGHLVIQTLTLGMDVQKEMFQGLLNEILNPKSIYERNDSNSRKLEGLSITKGVLAGTIPELINIYEKEAQFLIDIQNGHKTGFYLDQRDSRNHIAPYARNRKVLDVFCYTGAFSVHALLNGAGHVTCVDISEDAISIARKNMALNRLDQANLITANGFDFLKTHSKDSCSYDMIILDPPSFTRQRAQVPQALSGYKEINLRAMKMLPTGGILVTASCSHHIHYGLFEKMLISAAQDSKRTLKLLKLCSQALDHPVLPHIPETHYLSCAVFEVLD